VEKHTLPIWRAPESFGFDESGQFRRNMTNLNRAAARRFGARKRRQNGGVPNDGL